MSNIRLVNPLLSVQVEVERALERVGLSDAWQPARALSPAACGAASLFLRALLRENTGFSLAGPNRLGGSIKPRKKS